MRILIIEDDPDVMETVRSVFENFFDKLEIYHIGDGNEFRKKFWCNGPWDIVILDLMMPGVTGFEVCESLRANKPTKDVPILALTGYDTLQNEKKIKKAGASGYMAKPFVVTEFLEEIKRLIKTYGKAA